MEEKNKKKQMQEINLSVLEEMTDILTKEEIEKIASKVRREFYENNIETDSQKNIDNSLGWFKSNSTVIISTFLTTLVCFIGFLNLENKKMIGDLVLLVSHVL